jgi:hypothetical protein
MQAYGRRQDPVAPASDKIQNAADGGAAGQSRTRIVETIGGNHDHGACCGAGRGQGVTTENLWYAPEHYDVADRAAAHRADHAQQDGREGGNAQRGRLLRAGHSPGRDRGSLGYRGQDAPGYPARRGETQNGTRCECDGGVPGIGDASGDPILQKDVTEQATAEAADASAAQDANRI